MNSLISSSFLEAIHHNCEVSDARDHGIYSMCTMILRLRNLYKWEHDLEPWQEPEPPELLDWIENKENRWEHLEAQEYRELGIGGEVFEPFATEKVNSLLAGSGLFYGAGYGRAMKSVFFLGEIRETRQVRGLPLIIIGKEKLREMAGALAFVQDEAIVVRRDLIRYFFWDQIQDLQGTCRSSFLYALNKHGVRTGNKLDYDGLRANFDKLIDTELDIFIFHEVGERLEKSFNSDRMKALVGRFPGSVVEFVCRTIKDLLGDTHPEGLLAHLVAENRFSGIGFYVGFLDGLRQRLFPELTDVWASFMKDGDWRHIEKARQENRSKCLALGGTLSAIADDAGSLSDRDVIMRFCNEILRPLGLDLPEGY